MKKNSLLFLLLCLLIPWNVNAASPVSVSDVRILIENEATVGEETKVTIKTSLAGVGSGGEDDSIVVELAYGIITDNNTIALQDMTQEDWPVEFVEIENTGTGYVSNYYDRKLSESCRERKYCTSVSMPMTFFVNETNEPDVRIHIEKIGLVYIKSEKLEEYLKAAEIGFQEREKFIEENGEVYFQDINRSNTIKIKQSGVTNVQVPTSKIDEKKTQASALPEIKNQIKSELGSNTNNTSPNNNPSSNPSSNENATSSPEKSKNSNLSVLEIEGYPIAFDKEWINYEIFIESKVNSLNVKATPEDSKATYQIIGAEDLKKNKDQVTVEVTAENNEKKTYTIHANRKEDPTTDKKENILAKINFKLEKGHIVLGIGLCVLVLLILLVKKWKDRRIDKALKNL